MKDIISKNHKKSKFGIFSLVKSIPKGKVMTYKIISEMAGIKNPRVVGSILHANTDPENIPCHRVVRSDGHVATGYAFGGKKSQIKRLEEEGIIVYKGKIDLEKYIWNPLEN